MNQQAIEKAARAFGSLYGRWLDESQYEDINDYAKAMQTHHLPTGAKIESISKRPFKLVFVVDGKRYFLRANAREVLFGEL